MAARVPASTNDFVTVYALSSAQGCHRRRLAEKCAPPAVAGMVVRAAGDRGRP